MNIISLFNSFCNHLNNILDNNLSFHELECKIADSTYSLNLDVLKEILEYIDLLYKHSKERKDLYYVKETRSRTLITSLGLISFRKTYYISKQKVNGKYHFFSYLEDYLGIDKWAKMTLKAEVNLISSSLDNGMSWASLNAIPGYVTTRQTISKKIKSINYNYDYNISKVEDTPNTIYIEADEVHSHLQSRTKGKKNRIVPVILIHEGHKEDVVRKKQLSNKHYIASSILKTDKLWNEAFNYIDLKYDINKIKYLFISGDGGSWIKQYLEAFPNAIYVYDKFHYRKLLNYIFKKDPLKTKFADQYLRNKMICEFKLLVKAQADLYPNQRKYIFKNMNTLLNNIEGILNQNHPKYKCPCSMEGTISNYYARFLTSRPHAYSPDGLENTVQLLTLKANNIKLTEELYHQFKYGISTYKQLNLEKFITNFRLQSNQIYKNIDSTHSVDNSNFNLKDNYRLDFFLNHRL